jgi:hypothetical protein
MNHGTLHSLGIHPSQPLQVLLLGQGLRLKTPHLAGASGVAVWALPAHDNSHGWVLGKTHCVIGVVVAGKAAVDRLSEQRNQVVADISSGTALLEVVLSDIGKAQGIIKLSKGKKTSV